MAILSRLQFLGSIGKSRYYPHIKDIAIRIIVLIITVVWPGLCPRQGKQVPSSPGSPVHSAKVKKIGRTWNAFAFDAVAQLCHTIDLSVISQPSFVAVID